MRRTQTVTAHGTALLWACDPEDLERFLRDRPEMVDWRRVEAGYWRDIAQQAHERAGYVRIEEAAAMLGVTPSMVLQHIRKGWLPATVGAKQDRGGRGPWLIRRADLALFRPRKPGLIGHPGWNRRAA